jgi:hypothetical protein
MAKCSGGQRGFFLAGLESAKKCGLVYEFISFYKRDRRNGSSVSQATWYAVCEWDIG